MRRTAWAGPALCWSSGGDSVDLTGSIGSGSRGLTMSASARDPDQRLMDLSVNRRIRCGCMARRTAGRPSLATIADQVGVSTATVSNCFNRPEKVSPDVRQRVLAEAERQHYAGPDPAARQLSRGRTDTVGLLFTAELVLRLQGPGGGGVHRGSGDQLPGRRPEHAADLDGVLRRQQQRGRQRRGRRLRRVLRADRRRAPAAHPGPAAADGRGRLAGGDRRGWTGSVRTTGPAPGRSASC